MGHLIPAGTGLKKYDKVILLDEIEEMEEAIEEKVETS